MSIEQRLRALEDRAQIQDLLVRYAVLLDDCRWDDLAQLFTADAVFASPNSSTVGRAAVIENFKVKHAPWGFTLHDPHASVITVFDDNHAQGTVIGYAELANPDSTLVTFIRYQDDYRREEGAWRFAARHVLSSYGMTTSDYVAGMVGQHERKRWPNRPLGAAELPDIEGRYPGYLGLS